ncbi:MAG: MBL fold metallo-hydrolase [Hydrogenovibrio crunogenus]|nr:MBL fold metallo-hydrolase [Hydrogenovibrio crunogenus]
MNELEGKRTQMRLIFLALIVFSLILAASPMIYASPQKELSDPYLKGFSAYAKEIGPSNGAQDVYENYVNEVAKVEQKAGYIGPILPLPKPVKVMDGVYTVVGSLIWHNPSNYGLNNNLTFMVFDDGVFVFNAGPNPAVAASFHRQIQTITHKPVKWVAVENSQGHAYLGASYWVDIGVKKLYSHQRANEDFHQGFDAIKSHWSTRVGKVLTHTARDVSDQFITFDDKMTVDVGGGETVEILNFGPGHTPGSTLLYVPSRKLLLTGDLAYNSRMLALFSYTNTLDWVGSFERMMASIPKDVSVIPGHGAPTNMATIKRDTYDYLKYMHSEVQKIIERDGTEEEALLIDQSQYQYRSVYEQTHQNNASHIYREMTGGDLGQNFE